MTEAIDIGSRVEPFLDPFLMERSRGVNLRLHRPVRREVVLETDQPFESSTSGYYNLFRDGNRIRMYYRGYHPGKKDKADDRDTQTVNLAESTDGIHFERPAFGLYEHDGSKQNNIVWEGTEGHNFCGFRDESPACKEEERYKAVGGYLFALASPDGIHWKRMQEDKLDVEGAFDSLNVAFWDPLMGCYRLFSRYFEPNPGGAGGVRAIQSSTSDDFIHWTEPVPHQYGPEIPLEHFYTNATTPCPGAGHILLSFPKRFVPARTRDTEGMVYPSDGISDAVFMSSRDGVHWDRTFMEAWVRPGQDRRNWTHRSNMAATGIIETAPGEWSMYISEHYGWASNRLRRLTLRPHGLAAMHADYAGGEFVTKLLTFSGNRLHLNYATSAAGSIRVEIQDETAKPRENFALDDMEPIFGDELDAPVAWKSGGDLSALSGRPVRFRFVLQDADLFALRTGSG